VTTGMCAVVLLLPRGVCRVAGPARTGEHHATRPTACGTGTTRNARRIDPIEARLGAGPRYERHGTVRVWWADPVGWAGLVRVAPNPDAEQELLDARTTQIDTELADLKEQISAGRRDLGLAARAWTPGSWCRCSAHCPTWSAWALDGVGFLLTVVALQTLPLFVVEAFTAGSLAVTDVAAAACLRLPLSRGEWLGVAAVTAGLVALGLSAPVAGSVALA